jgi:cyclic-di-GMP-binding protein
MTMAQDFSFDVVSQVNMQGMDNAVNQAMKEISQRYDFKGLLATISLEANGLKFEAQDEYKLEAMVDVLRLKLVKCGVSTRCLTPGKIEQASKGTIRQLMSIQSGIAVEKAKEVVAAIKGLKLKVQAQIMGEQVRVSGAKKDELQKVMAHLREQDFGIDLQFINMRP